MAQDEQFEHESFQDNETIGKYLGALLEGFQKGTITLSSEGDQMVLTPNNILQFQVKARKKGSKNKLSIKISWKESKGHIDRERSIRIGTTPDDGHAHES
jgi:amphi-Trp domain-containing protein